MTGRDLAIQYAHENNEKFIREMVELTRIPSISTNEVNKKDVAKTAEWVANKLRSVGIDNVTVFPTAGHPVVFGEYLKAGKDKPIVLVYGHYDVQPVEPIDQWKSDPFEPDFRGENVYARGISDMKGQFIASICAIESIMQQGSFPVNLKFLIEGEEEIGSPNLAPFLREKKDLLACDVCLNPDAGMLAPDVPTIVYGLRGLAYFELRVYGPEHDLHSGVFGGVVKNPAIALCELIAGMHDENGRVTLPGFYDRVVPLSDQERAELARLPITEQTFITQTGAPATDGEKGYTTVERVGGRPTLDVNGMISGFTAKGSKTIIPGWAMAKISTRLVPDQDPKEVKQQLEKYLTEHAPKTVRWELETMAGGPACGTDINLPATKALAKALETAWGIKPVYKREGGSVPIVAEMQDILKIQSVMSGFGLPDDNFHAPNEKLHLPTWKKGIDALIHFFYNLAE